MSVHSLDEMIRLLLPQEEKESMQFSAQESSAGLEGSALELEDRLREEEKMVVLGPSHPKMQRFQDALKKHLEKQIYIAECQERDLVS